MSLSVRTESASRRCGRCSSLWARRQHEPKRARSAAPTAGLALLLPPVADVILPAMAGERITDIIAATPMASFAARMAENHTHLRRVII